MFPTLLHSVTEVHSRSRGLFWRKRSHSWL